MFRRTRLTQFTSRGMHWRFTTASLAAVLVILALVLAPRLATAQIPEQTDLERAGPVIRWAEAINRGDANAAAQPYAENAFFVGGAATGLCSLETPCYGREAIRSLQESLAGSPGFCLLITSIQVNGSLVTGRHELRTDSFRARGIERDSLGFLAQVLNGEIVSFFGRRDLGDLQTAMGDAIRAGTLPPGAPIDRPDPVCRSSAPLSRLLK